MHGFCWGREAAGGGGPRHQAAVPAGTGVPARLLLGGTRERDGEQQQVLERVECTLVGGNGRSDPRFVVAASNGAGG
jgi:hypothetical protein